MKLHILIVLFITFCTSCREKQAKYQDPYLATPLSNSIISEWTYGFPFYSSRLVINQDGSFKFHDQGCMGHRYTEGNWVQIGNKVISLKSFEKFKVGKRPIVVEVESDYQEINPTEKGNYNFDKIAFTSRTFKINISETTNVYFDNIRLMLSDDFLYCPDPGEFMGGTTFSAKKNYR